MKNQSRNLYRKLVNPTTSNNFPISHHGLTADTESIDLSIESKSLSKTDLVNENTETDIALLFDQDPAGGQQTG